MLHCVSVSVLGGVCVCSSGVAGGVCWCVLGCIPSKLLWMYRLGLASVVLNFVVCVCMCMCVIVCVSMCVCLGVQCVLEDVGL